MGIANIRILLIKDFGVFLVKEGNMFEIIGGKMKHYNILVIGCGGGGSWLVEELCRKIEQGQISASLEIADDDMVEMKQIRFDHNFTREDLGKNKAEVLVQRFGEMDIWAKKRITTYRQLNGYDIIMLCVDNDKTREMVIKYCHRNDKEFFDLRATGRRMFVMPKEKKIEDNLKHIDSKDLNNYSCQDKKDIKKNYQQETHKITALWGVQMLLNYIRGYDNYTFTKVV